MIKKSEETYIGKESISTQYINVLYHCQMNSISKVGKARVSVWSSQYKVNGLPSGNIFLKGIIQESHLDTKLKTASIRTQLISLDAYIRNVGCDITKFNAHDNFYLQDSQQEGKQAMIC